MPAAQKGCFIEQARGRSNMIVHNLKTRDGWMRVIDHAIAGARVIAQ